MRHRKTSARRRGLAPVELVLAIPLVMFIMALSVIVGTASCWKIRASVAARNAIWSYRMPRSDVPPNPRATAWPQPATTNHMNSRPLADLNHPAFGNPLVRGPLPGQVIVNAGLFNPTQAIRLGRSSIQRTPAMLPRLGPYQFNPEHPLLDGKWQFRQMGLASNQSRRLPVLYQLPDGDSSAKAVFVQAYQSIVGAPFRRDLDVLDRDDEFFAWYGSAPDFHPGLGIPCTLDLNLVTPSIQRFLPRIDGQPRSMSGRRPPSGVPRSMTNAFLAMYRQQLQALQNSPPPLTADQQAQIAALQQKIQILRDFLSTLN